MAHGPPAQRALQDLIRHCHTGLAAPDLQRRLLHSLRCLVPADAAFFATADPASLLFTGGFAEEPLDAVTALFLDNEFGAADVNKFAGLATSPTHIASLDAVTSGDRFASPRYREIMRPLGLGDEMRVALMTGGQCWGYLCLHRTDHATGFTESDVSRVAAAAPHLAHALRQALLQTPAAASRSHEPGVLMLAEDLSLVAATAQASEYLALIETPSSLPLPVCIYTAAAAARAIEHRNAAPQSMPITRVHARTGQWLTIHASQLNGSRGESGITVVITESDPSSTLQMRLSAYGLSPREAEVATLVLRGTATSGISTTLHISEHTVQDHLKSVFDKAGVRSRRELIGTMLN